MIESGVAYDERLLVGGAKAGFEVYTKIFR